MAESVIESGNGNIFMVGLGREKGTGGWLSTGGTHELMGGRVLYGYVAIFSGWSGEVYVWWVAVKMRGGDVMLGT